MTSTETILHRKIAGGARLIRLTGPPNSGKSTFIRGFGDGARMHIDYHDCRLDDMQRAMKHEDSASTVDVLALMGGVGKPRVRVIDHLESLGRIDRTAERMAVATLSDGGPCPTIVVVPTLLDRRIERALSGAVTVVFRPPGGSPLPANQPLGADARASAARLMTANSGHELASAMSPAVVPLCSMIMHEALWAPHGPSPNPGRILAVYQELAVADAADAAGFSGQDHHLLDTAALMRLQACTRYIRREGTPQTSPRFTRILTKHGGYRQARASLEDAARHAGVTLDELASPGTTLAKEPGSLSKLRAAALVPGIVVC